MKTEVTKKQIIDFLKGITHSANMTKAAWESEGLGCVHLASYLTTKGIAWRTAYYIIKGLWFWAKQEGKSLRSLTNEELHKFSPYLNHYIIWDLLNPEKNVRKKYFGKVKMTTAMNRLIRKEEKWLKTTYKDLGA